MFDGEGGQLAGHVGETAPHAARLECRAAFARGFATRRETVGSAGQRRTDRRGERGSRPQNATLRLTISLQKSKGTSGLAQQRCENAGDRRIQTKLKMHNESKEKGNLLSFRDGKGNPTGSKYRHHRPIRILLKDLSYNS
jgi:hypothetical protein